MIGFTHAGTWGPRRRVRNPPSKEDKTSTEGCSIQWRGSAETRGNHNPGSGEPLTLPWLVGVGEVAGIQDELECTGRKPGQPDQSQEGFSRSEKRPGVRFQVIRGFSSVETLDFSEMEDFEQMDVMI